ncbi:MAG: exported protein of unknown function [Acidobacteria bacterium]|nr:exported protein of unknown function [Acidobacteriota bacterium]
MNAILRFTREIVLKNWGLKLTSILLAFALWLMVRGGQGERVFTVPLTFSIPRDMEIVNERPGLVEITAQGTLPSLLGSQPDLIYNIDLLSAEEGEHTVALTPAGVRIGPGSGIRVVRVSPARVTLVLERVISKDVPIRVPVNGKPAQNSEIYTMTYQPDIVSITGPRSSVNSIQEVSTDPVPVVNKESSFDARVNFRISNDDIHTSPVGPVFVSVEVGPKRELRTIHVPVTVMGEDAYATSPSSITVSVLVPVTYKEGLTAKDFQARVTVPDAEASSVQAAVKPVVEMTIEPVYGMAITGFKPEEVLLLKKARKK